MSAQGRKRSTTDYETLLGTKLCSKLSWAKWKSVQKANNAPISRNKLQCVAASLDITYATPMYTCVGAYIPSVAVFHNLAQEYLDADALTLHPLKPSGSFWVKLSIDSTKVFYSKMEGYYLSLLDVEKNQSTKHQAILALSQTEDVNFEMQRVVTETDMLSLVSGVQNTTITKDDVAFSFVLFLTLDWICLVTELDLKNPKWAKADDIGCGFCGELMGVFRGTWWHDPFKKYTTTKQISDYPGALFPNLPLTNRRYCGMHLSNCLLSISLLNLYQLVPPSLRTHYKSIIQKVYPKWTPPRKYLEANQMKSFFSRGLHHEMVELFYSIHGEYDLPFPEHEEKIIFPAWRVAALLLDSARVYYQFSYTDWPTPADFSAISSARIGVLATFAGMKWRMKPTIHYATNEFLDFAQLDGTAYHTLNEGPESMHKEIKQLASTSMKNIKQAQTGDNCFQQVINHHNQQRELRRMGKVPLQYQLQPVNIPTTPNPSFNFAPLKFLPL